MTLPTRAMLGKRKRPLRVLYYGPDKDYFTLLDTDDSRVYAHRDNLMFIK